MNPSKILRMLHEDDEVRKSFQQILRFLLNTSIPPDPAKAMETISARSVRLEPYSESEFEQMSLVFDQQLMALINLQRAMDVNDGDVKIGHWCSRDQENYVKGMEGWSIYWLTLCDDPVHVEQDLYEQNEIDLTLWAVGIDDNAIQKAIKVWAEAHFKHWRVEYLQCVRR